MLIPHARTIENITSTESSGCHAAGCNAKGAPIADEDEVPTECGVMLWQAERLHVLRVAPKRAVPGLDFALWMALAKATPLPGYAQAAADWGDQALLSDSNNNA